MSKEEFSDLHKFMLDTFGVDITEVDLEQNNLCPVCGDGVVPTEQKVGHYMRFLDTTLDYDGTVYQCRSCDFEADEDNWLDHFQNGLPDWM